MSFSGFVRGIVKIGMNSVRKAIILKYYVVCVVVYEYNELICGNAAGIRACDDVFVKIRKLTNILIN
jgi:hypothetical protein